MKANPGPHSDDEIPEDKRHDLDGVDGMVAEPEQAAHGTCKRNADQEGIGEFLPESSLAGDNASWKCDRNGLV